MNTHADKTSENKSQAVTNSLPKLQSIGESAVQFVDNRPEAIAQRKLQKAIDNSPRVQQLKAYQKMANNSPQVKQLKVYQAMANNFTSQTVQRKENLEEETLQGKFEPIQEKENNTGLPDNLKLGIENLSGYSMNDVQVHRNSDKPAQLQAHAYAQGTDIHLGPGQEKHLPHEAWHVVQQKQGRVKPTIQMKGGVNVNDDAELETEADVMSARASGLRALQMKSLHQIAELDVQKSSNQTKHLSLLVPKSNTIQRSVTIGNGQSLTSWSDIENKLSQSDLDRIKAYPEIKLKMQNLLLSVENHPFPYVTDLINYAFDFLHPTSEATRAVATTNSDQMPYAVDAFHESQNLMQGVNKVTSSVKDIFSSIRGLSPSGVGSGFLGFGKGMLQVGMGLLNKRTWKSALPREHPNIQITKAVALENPELVANYEQTKRDMIAGGVAPNETELYSGHGRFVMSLINKGGHHPGKTPYNPTKGFGAMGAGTYLTDRFDKAASYAIGNSVTGNGEFSVIKYKVLLGNIEVLADKTRRHSTNDDLVEPRWWPDDKRPERYYPQSPNPRTARSAFHSRKSAPGVGHTPGASAAMALWHKDTLDSEEYLVRNPTQILPISEIFFIQLSAD